MGKYSSETREIVRNLRLIDDEMLRCVADDIHTCREIIYPFLGDEKLQVIEAKTQVTEVGIRREIKLDVKCRLNNGTICNVEVQKSKDNDDMRRTRFHTSMLTVNDTPKGTKFEDIPDVIAIYISEYDVLRNGQRITWVKRCQKMDNQYIPVDDGELIIFANTIFTDEEKNNMDTLSEIDQLLMLFTKRDVFYNKNFPNISDRFRYFKEDNEGVDTMCLAVEQYGDKRAAEAERIGEERGEERGEKRGQRKALENTARNMKDENIPVNTIMKITGLSEEEINLL